MNALNLYLSKYSTIYKLNYIYNYTYISNNYIKKLIYQVVYIKQDKKIIDVSEQINAMK